VVPAEGVITSWSFQDGAKPVTDLKLKVGRPAGGNNYIVIGESSAPSQTPNAVNNYPASIPVQAGDLIGIYQHGGNCAVQTADPLNSAVYVQADPAPGPSPVAFLPFTEYVFPVQATITKTEAPLPPSNQFRIGKLHSNRKKGTAKSPIFVPGPGVIQAQDARRLPSSSRAGRPAKKTHKPLIKPATVIAAAAGKVLLPLIPTAAGRKILKAKGRFRVKVHVTFTPTGGTPASQTFSPVLKLNLKKRH
jgi:hypothetical protein